VCCNPVNSPKPVIAAALTPLVTIYIPTKNRPALLRRAVLSCLNQSWSHLEIIVVDDGSEHCYSHELSSIAALDSRIKLIQLTESVGACVARNVAIFQAKGEFITGLDDDDEFTPDRVESFYRAWMADSQPLAFLCSGYQVISTDASYQFGKKSRLISQHDLLYANHVGNQVFTRTEYLQAIDGFDASFRSWQDYDCWFRLCQRFGSGKRLACCSYLLYQNHNEQRISTSDYRHQGYERFLEKHGPLMSAAQKQCQQFYLLLNSGSWSVFQLLRLANSQTWFVALKNIGLRWISVFRRLGQKVQ